MLFAHENPPQAHLEQFSGLDVTQFNGVLRELVCVFITEGFFTRQQDLTDFSTILWQAYPIFRGDQSKSRWTGDFDQGRQFVDQATTARFGVGIDLYNIFVYKNLPPINIMKLYELLSR